MWAACSCTLIQNLTFRSSLWVSHIHWELFVWLTPCSLAITPLTFSSLLIFTVPILDIGCAYLQRTCNFPKHNWCSSVWGHPHPCQGWHNHYPDRCQFCCTKRNGGTVSARYDSRTALCNPLVSPPCRQSPSYILPLVDKEGPPGRPLLSNGVLSLQKARNYKKVG